MSNQDNFSTPSNTIPPASPSGGNVVTAPAVVRWYKIYAIFMAVVCAVTAYLGYYALKNPEAVLAILKGLGAEDLRMRAIILLVAGGVLGVSFLASLFQRRTSGAWIFQAILISINVGNCCLWLVMIPLMIGWLKPETQRWFGRNPGNSQGSNGA